MSNYLIACVPKRFKKPDGTEGSSLTRVGAFFPFKESRGGRLKIDEGISVHGELILCAPNSGDDAERVAE